MELRGAGRPLFKEETTKNVWVLCHRRNLKCYSFSVNSSKIWYYIGKTLVILILYCSRLKQKQARMEGTGLYICGAMPLSSVPRGRGQLNFHCPYQLWPGLTFAPSMHILTFEVFTLTRVDVL